MNVPASTNVRVNWRDSLALTGTVVKYLSLTLLVPLVVALVYREDLLVFLATILLTVSVGHLLEQCSDEPDLQPREAILLVALAWLFVAILGAVPYVLAGYGTSSTLAHPVNALFESMSGFTTTGATVMGDISFDSHSRAIMMWRQLSQWLGGMGIIVLMVAILPELAVNGAQLIQSEAPGPNSRNSRRGSRRRRASCGWRTSPSRSSTSVCSTACNWSDWRST